MDTASPAPRVSPPNTQSLEDQSLRVLVSDNQPRESVGSLEDRFAPARNKYDLIQKISHYSEVTFNETEGYLKQPTSLD